MTPNGGRRLSTRDLRWFVEEHSDAIVSLVGGVLMGVASGWWAVQAVRSDAPPDAPGFEGVYAVLWAGPGALALLLGVLALRLRASRPRIARRCGTSGRIVVVAVACVYVVGRLALIQME